jgi:hypothetical protein
MVPHLPMPEEDDPLVTPEQEEFRRRAVRAVLIVAGIAAGIGLLIGGLTSAALYVSGVLPQSAPAPAVNPVQPEEENSIPTPSLLPTRPTPEKPAPVTASPSPTRTPSPSSTPSRTPSPSPSPSPTKSRKPAGDRRDHAIVLHAGAGSVGSYEQVTLSGRYPGGDGTTLQVQRREGGSWADFPTSASVEDGTFSTYVASGQSGPNAFRVVDPATGRVSNVVVVTVS